MVAAQTRRVPGAVSRGGDTRTSGLELALPVRVRLCACCSYSSRFELIRLCLFALQAVLRWTFNLNSVQQGVHLFPCGDSTLLVLGLSSIWCPNVSQSVHAEVNSSAKLEF